jgi:hypothetical protein
MFLIVSRTYDEGSQISIREKKCKISPCGLNLYRISPWSEFYRICPYGLVLYKNGPSVSISN